MLTVVAIVALAAGSAACSSSGAEVTVGPSTTAAATSSTTAASITVAVSKVCAPSGANSLREAAVAWAKATLTGTICDILNLQGPECLTVDPGSPDLSARARAAADAEVRREHADLQQHLGVALSSVKITGVLVRSVTATTGEAEVQYNLPASVVGNDNWVAYELLAGEWKVSDCHGPIGGNSTSDSVTITTATP